METEQNEDDWCKLMFWKQTEQKIYRFLSFYIKLIQFKFRFIRLKALFILA